MLLQKDDKIIITKKGIMIETLPKGESKFGLCILLSKNKSVLTYLGHKRIRDVVTNKPKMDAVFKFTNSKGESFKGTITQNCFNCFKSCKNLKPKTILGKKCHSSR